MGNQQRYKRSSKNSTHHSVRPQTLQHLKNQQSPHQLQGTGPTLPQKLVPRPLLQKISLLRPQEQVVEHWEEPQGYFGGCVHLLPELRVSLLLLRIPLCFAVAGAEAEGGGGIEDAQADIVVFEGEPAEGGGIELFGGGVGGEVEVGGVVEVDTIGLILDFMK